MTRFPVLLAVCVVVAATAAPAGADPRIVSVGIDPADPFSLAIVAEDPRQPVGSVAVHFGAGEGAFAESACRLTRKGRPSGRGAGRRTFRVPWLPVLLGLRTVDVRVSSGSCGAEPREVRKAFKVSVARGRAKAAQLNLRPCRHAFLRPTEDNRGKARRAVTCLINVQRTAAGVRPLGESVALRRAGRRHSLDMLARDYFAHQRPGGPTLAQRLQGAGFWPASAGENIARAGGSLSTPFSIVLAWLRSDGHRENLLDRDFTHVGTGIAVAGSTAVYTMDLGRRY